MRNRVWKYLSLVLVIGMTVVNSSVAQSSDPFNTLTLRLFLPEPSVCIGTTQIEAELELRNLGNKDLRISNKGFGAAVDFLAIYNSEDGRPRSESLQTVGDSFSKPVPSASQLKPGDSFRVPGAVVLTNPIFRPPGFYKVRIDYSGDVSTNSGVSRRIHLSSNWVLFEVKGCEP